MGRGPLENGSFVNRLGPFVVGELEFVLSVAHQGVIKVGLAGQAHSVLF